MDQKQTSAFRALHQAGNPFILANAWDVGSAKIMAALGAKAIASTSAGHAFTLGVKDMGHITLEQSLQHCRDLVQASILPVSGDLENGYGDAPLKVAESIRMAAEVGLEGACIEDYQLPLGVPYAFEFAVERIEAAAMAAKALTQDFVLTARADGVMNGHYSTDEAIRRIQAYESAGADVVYVPLPPTMQDLARICTSVDIPVNALAAGDFARYSLADFAQAGVARVSLGSSLVRLMHATLMNSSRALFSDGDFTSFLNGVSGDEVEALFETVKEVKEGKIL